jgi:ankyrin repeat protein
MLLKSLFLSKKPVVIYVIITKRSIMPFLERLQSAMILKTPMHKQYETHMLEHLHAPFYEAILNDDKKTIKIMIEDGFNIDFHEAAHIPPLIYSIIHNKKDISLYLLQQGADVNIKTSKGESALHVSIKLEYFEMITLLIEFGADIPNIEDIDSLKVRRHIESLDITPPSKESCFISAKRGDIISLSLTCNADKKLFFATQNGYNLLHLAIYSKNIETIIYLLNRGLDIDSVDNNSNTALTIASKFKDNEEIVSLLIRRYATLDHKNAQSHTPLCIALQHGNAKIAKILIKNGANIHLACNLHTPLTLTHNAIFKYPQTADEFRVIETELLIKGAHVNIPVNALRWTPLYMTISKMQTHILKQHLKLLIRLGAEINYLDTNRRSALMIASSLGRYEAVEILLNNYAKIDILDNFGWSALMFGVYYNHYKVVELLLNSGADVNLSSKKKLNAIKIAKQHKRENIITLLLDYGAIEEENRE